jgi:hypothetical protein
MTITYSEESLERCKADIEYLMPEHWAGGCTKLRSAPDR